MPNYQNARKSCWFVVGFWFFFLGGGIGSKWHANSLILLMTFFFLAKFSIAKWNQHACRVLRNISDGIFFFVLVRWFYFVYLQKQNRKITSWSIKKWGKKMRLWFVERITWKSVSVQRESYRNMYSSSLSLSFSFCGLPPSTEVYSTNYQTNNKLNTQS